MSSFADLEEEKRVLIIAMVSINRAGTVPCEPVVGFTKPVKQGRTIIPRTPEYSGVKELSPELFGVGSEEISTPEHHMSIPDH